MPYRAESKKYTCLFVQLMLLSAQIGRYDNGIEAKNIPENA